MTDTRLTTALLDYIATRPDGAYVNDIAANVLGCGGYNDLRRTLDRLTSAGLLDHEPTGRDGVWADRWKTAEPH